MSSPADACLNRIQNHVGISAVIVADDNDNMLRPAVGIDGDSAEEFTAAVRQLALKASDVVRCLDPQNTLNFLRVRSKKQELLVGLGDKFLISVIQDPSQQSSQSKN